MDRASTSLVVPSRSDPPGNRPSVDWLRPGDLIKDVDGAALTDPQQATQIFQGLGDKDQVSVTVERNGSPEVLVLRTSQLELDSQQ